jgi:uncharacterized membrane protein YidH (DUF202 family)
MDYQEELNIERYKVITDRQKYFTDLTKDTFNIYMRTFVYIITGIVALVSFMDKFSIPENVMTQLIKVLISLLTIIAVSSCVQILFCLIRWYSLKNQEKQINTAAKVEWWAWIYEGMYMAVIVVSVFFMYAAKNEIRTVITQIEKTATKVSVGKRG